MSARERPSDAEVERIESALADLVQALEGWRRGTLHKRFSSPVKRALGRARQVLREGSVEPE